MAAIQTFDSLAEAAQGSFPPESCRLVALRQQADTGYALFDTRPSAEPYLYEVYYDRRDGRWSEGSSGNGPGWHRIDDTTELGALTEWGEAPAGADRVRVTHEGKVWEEAVSNRAYLFIWWDIPRPAAFPTLVSFRVNDEWTREPE